MFGDCTNMNASFGRIHVFVTLQKSEIATLGANNSFDKWFLIGIKAGVGAISLDENLP